MFKVGQRVICSCDVGDFYMSWLEGIIVSLHLPTVGVSFKENIWGHDCGWTCEDWHGWNVYFDTLTPINDNKKKEFITKLCLKSEI